MFSVKYYSCVDMIICSLAVFPWVTGFQLRNHHVRCKNQTKSKTPSCRRRVFGRDYSNDRLPFIWSIHEIANQIEDLEDDFNSRGSWEAARRLSSSRRAFKLCNDNRSVSAGLKPLATKTAASLSFTRRTSTQQMLIGAAVPGTTAWEAIRWNICRYRNKVDITEGWTGNKVN